MHYQILSAFDAPTLTQKVENQREMGWTCQGGVSVVAAPQEFYKGLPLLFYQAMIRKNLTIKDSVIP